MIQLMIFFVCIGCSTPSGGNHTSEVQTKPVSHQLFDQLLKKHVNSEGWVDYEGFKRDRQQLQQYLELLQSTAPSSNWTEEEKLAYWINVYNAFTIELILQHYPLESIKDIGSKIQIPFVNTPWDIKFIKIGGEELDLNNVEHSILRKEFEEPRIHFAINCASYSCPVLRAEAYTADKLESQLNEQAVSFLNDPRRNRISSRKAELSKIFDWFSGDFTKKTKLIGFINQYSKTKIDDKTQIIYLDYDWALNDSKNY